MYRDRQKVFIIRIDCEIAYFITSIENRVCDSEEFPIYKGVFFWFNKV